MAESERLVVPVGELDWARGPADAPITLVEYGDFEDPECRRAHFVMHQLELAMGERLRFVFRHYPLTHQHKYAQRAAEAAEAAGAQGRFWEMYDLLFTRKDVLELWDPEAIAHELRIEPGRFLANVQGRAFLDRVRQATQDARKSGVSATPTFFINGRLYEGEFDLDSLSRALGVVEPEVQRAMQP